MVNFDPKKDIPDLSGKTVLVTGGTNGLGKETLSLLAAHGPSQLIFTGRNTSAGEAIVSTFQPQYPSITISFIPCDLASLSSVRDCAHQILTTQIRLDILLLVAGVLTSEPSLTTDGYELHFGTNHLGHALLIKLLLPLLHRTASAPQHDPRIILISSAAAESATLSLSTVRTTMSDIPWYQVPSMKRYGHSKLANVLYARALAKHHPDIISVSMHPGVASTGIARTMPWPVQTLIKAFGSTVLKTPEEVAWGGVWAATAKRDEVKNGAYYRPVGVDYTGVGQTGDDELAEELWEWTEKELADYN